MAAVAIWDTRVWIGKVIRYAMNPEKTKNPLHDKENMDSQMECFVSGINCDLAMATPEMNRTKKQFGKEDGITGFHGYQSFVKGEVRPEIAHEIGVKFAKELWGDRFQIVVATHLDHEHVHNHFVVNSVSFLDGKRFYDNKQNQAMMRKVSDRLCREYHLSVIEHPGKDPSPQYASYAQWDAEQRGQPTWRSLIREDIDDAISRSITVSQFVRYLEKQGYEISRRGKYTRIRPPGKAYFVRLTGRSLGKGYSEQNILDRLLMGNPLQKQKRTVSVSKRTIKLNGIFQKDRSKVTGLRALYYHYLYRLGVFPRNGRTRKIPSILWEDIRKMDSYFAQGQLLSRNHIATAGQLFSYKEQLEQELNSLVIRRTNIGYRIRRTRDEDEICAYKEERTSINYRLSFLRKEVKLCDGILSRSTEMKEKIQQIKQAEIQQRKEEKKREHRSRSGG